MTSDSSDKVLADTAPGLFKTEGARPLEAVEPATLDWLDGFNHHRLLGPIGFILPAEAEAAIDNGSPRSLGSRQEIWSGFPAQRDRLSALIPVSCGCSVGCSWRSVEAGVDGA